MVKWDVGKKDCIRAIKLQVHGTPGPDTITYRAWRNLGKIGIEVLWNTIKALNKDNASEELRKTYNECGWQKGTHAFNHAAIVCILKEPSGAFDNGYTWPSPENTRPLGMVNKDNRIIAAAVKNKWETFLNEAISQKQKGFLKNRSMLSSVVHIEWDAMRITLKERTGCTSLSNFKAAFPSIEHDYMHAILCILQIPTKCENITRILHEDNGAY